MADVVTTHVAYSSTIIRRPNALLRVMARRPELFCLLVAFILTLAGKYGNSFQNKPISLPPKQPQYFFPPASTPVIDAPRGSLLSLIQALNKDEFVVVMYYAPWCSKSQAARSEYLKAANYFRGRVTFASVNCWWPEGDCKKRYKFLMFPVVMVYYSQLDGYRYSDVMRAEYLIKFIENLLHPVDLLHSVQETVATLAKYETVVLGYFNLSSFHQEKSYRQFFYAAMRIVEKDYLQPLRFAVLTDGLVASQFNLSKFQDIVLLRLFNSTLMYPFENNITSTNLVAWALFHKDQPSVKRLSPEGLKSRQLADEVSRGPALIMFHSENPLFQGETGLHVLKTIALHFRRCLLNPSNGDILEVWPKLIQADLDSYEQATKMCNILRTNKQVSSRALSCCISTVISHLQKQQKLCSICSSLSSSCSSLQSQLPGLVKDLEAKVAHSCQNIQFSYGQTDRWNVCCEPQATEQQNSSQLEFISQNLLRNSAVHEQNSQSMFYSSGDFHERRSTDRYIREHFESLPRRLCHKLVLERHQNLKSSWSIDVDSELKNLQSQGRMEQFSELGCRSNTSLHFFSMDSQNHWMFSDRLGVPQHSINTSPTAVIFDKLNEEHYVMEKNFTIDNTMSFIVDYETGRLQRHKDSHSFVESVCDISSHICVPELDSTNFLSFVHDDSKDVVVLIYAHWCGFCQTFSHTFLTAANYFATSQNIAFARINGATNDLPWHYTFDMYPVVILFPAHRGPIVLNAPRKRVRKSDSVVFPSERAKTLVNLIRFVVSHANLEARVDLAADVCTKSCIRQNLNRAQTLKRELLRKQKRLQQTLQTQKQKDESTVTHSKDKGQINSQLVIKRMDELTNHIENVQKLITYLEKNEQGEISKEVLMKLYSDQSASDQI